ncbi:MAG: hypothetical protein RIT45_2535 [Pseudomonadota bacterium]
MSARVDHFPPVRLAAPPTFAAGKAGWRAICEQLGRARPAAVRTRHAARLAEVGAALADGRSIAALYAPIGTEVDSRPLANALLVAGLRLGYPRLLGPDGAMEMGESAGPAALRARPRSRLLEPEGPAIPAEAIDLVFVPALGVDGALRRLGRAGGYYDRWLATLRPEALVVMVTPAACVLPWGAAEAHDRAGHLVLTEDGAFTAAETP